MIRGAKNTDLTGSGSTTLFVIVGLRTGAATCGLGSGSGYTKSILLRLCSMSLGLSNYNFCKSFNVNDCLSSRFCEAVSL